MRCLHTASCRLQGGRCAPAGAQRRTRRCRRGSARAEHPSRGSLRRWSQRRLLCLRVPEWLLLAPTMQTNSDEDELDALIGRVSSPCRHRIAPRRLNRSTAPQTNTPPKRARDVLRLYGLVAYDEAKRFTHERRTRCTEVLQGRRLVRDRAVTVSTPSLPRLHSSTTRRGHVASVFCGFCSSDSSPYSP
ncbi:hypothetical protein BC826DRAFT_410235 [Russula brevipes]|nr:hypothetical protein BC826DRAFT_410235 [Russula brevipes]